MAIFPLRSEAKETFRAHGQILARLAFRLHVPRPLARTRRALGARAEAADLRADRRHRRRADNQPARSHRRLAQLGLSLCMGARCGVHRLRVRPPRIHQRGRRLRELAAELCRASIRTRASNCPPSSQFSASKFPTKSRSIIGKATWAPARSASATPRTSNIRPISTAS